MVTQFHEDYDRGPAPRASERSFGLVFAGGFALVAFLPLLKGHDVRWWAAAVATAFLITAFTAPRLLAPLNRIWAAVGHLLHRIVSPVMLGILYLAAVVPTGLALRLKGADPLRLKFDHAAPSYWIKRPPAATSFTTQF